MGQCHENVYPFSISKQAKAILQTISISQRYSQNPRGDCADTVSKLFYSGKI